MASRYRTSRARAHCRWGLLLSGVIGCFAACDDAATGGGANQLDAGVSGGAGGAHGGSAGAPIPTGGFGGTLVNQYCLRGTIADYCSRQTCPTLSDARSRLRSFGSAFIERPCQNEQGAPRLLLHADGVYESTTYLFDAADASLVAVVTTYFESDSCGSGTSRGRFYGGDERHLPAASLRRSSGGLPGARWWARV